MAADYRSVKTAMWAQDEWFMDLPVDGKLLWVYLFTNTHTSVAGIYKLPLRTIAFETGIEPQRVRELLNLFGANQKAFYQDSTVWVSKMREHQATSSPLVIKRINTDLSALPDTPLKRAYLEKYRIDTVSIPHLENDSDTETDTETETETERRTTADFQTVQDKLIAQWRAVLGDTLTPAIFPEVRPYMRKLHDRGITDWWGLALAETTQARVPGWHYMKAVLESWLAAGEPSVKRNGSDPAKRTAGVVVTPERQAEIDRRQAEYEQQTALELVRLGMLS